MAELKINIQTNRSTDSESGSGGSSEGVSLKFKKIKLVDELTLDFEADENDNGTVSKIIKESGHPVHPDLIARFQALDVHLMLSCEIIDYPTGAKLDELNINPMVDKMMVTGLSFGGSDYEGVTLTGRKQLKNKRVLNLNAPYIKFNDESGLGYDYEAFLYSDVMRLLEEVKLYVGGKYGEGKQLNLFDDENLSMNIDSED